MHRSLTTFLILLSLFTAELSAQWLSGIFVAPAATVDNDDVTVSIRGSLNDQYEIIEEEYDVEDNVLTAHIYSNDEGWGWMPYPFRVSYNWGELEAGEYEVITYLFGLEDDEPVLVDTLASTFSVEEELEDWPNLVIRDLECHPSEGLVPYQNFHFTYTISNTGQERSADTSITSFYYSEDEEWSEDDRRFRQFSIEEDGLEAERNREVETPNFRLPDYLEQGEMYFIAYADYDHDVIEYDEEDNWTAVRVEIVEYEPNTTLVGQVDFDGLAQDVAVQGGYAYIAAGNEGLVIVDITDVEDPEVVESLDMDINATRLEVQGGFAYVVGNERWLKIVNISNHVNPREVGSYNQMRPSEIDLRGTNLFMVGTRHGFRVINVSDPADIQEVRHVDHQRDFEDICLDGDYAHCLHGNSVFTFNISNFENVEEISVLDTWRDVHQIVAQDDIAVTVSANEGMNIIDITDRENPALLGELEPWGNGVAVEIDHNFVCLASSQSGVFIIDLSDLDSPQRVGSYDTDGSALGLDVRSNLVYVADGDNGLCIIRNDLAEETGVQTTIELTEGWSMVSSHVNPYERDVQALFNQLRRSSNLFIVKDGEGRFYMPEFDYNGIPFWNFREGYLVNMYEPDRLAVYGEGAVWDTPISLTREWNMIAYFPEENVEAPVAFENIREILILAKDGEGRFYSPEFDFCNMLPLSRGYGYKVRVSRNVQLVWNLPE